MDMRFAIRSRHVGLSIFDSAGAVRWVCPVVHARAGRDLTGRLIRDIHGIEHWRQILPEWERALRSKVSAMLPMTWRGGLHICRFELEPRIVNGRQGVGSVSTCLAGPEIASPLQEHYGGLEALRFAIAGKKTLHIPQSLELARPAPGCRAQR